MLSVSNIVCTKFEIFYLSRKFEANVKIWRSDLKQALSYFWPKNVDFLNNKQERIQGANTYFMYTWGKYRCVTGLSGDFTEQESML